MPRYDFECGACSRVWEGVSSIDKRHNQSCPGCGGPAVLVIGTPSLATTFLNTEHEIHDLHPTEVYRVRTKAQYKDLLKRVGDARGEVLECRGLM